MSHPIAAIAAIAALALTAACSDDHPVAAASTSVAVNPDVGNAEAGIRKAGHDTAQDLRKLGAQARDETHKLASDLRSGGHDVNRRDRPYDKNS